MDNDARAGPRPSLLFSHVTGTRLTTPPPQPSSAPKTISDTPGVLKGSLLGKYRTGAYVSEKREILIQYDFPKQLRQMKVEDYDAFVLPPLPLSLKGKVGKIMAALKKQRKIVNGCWEKFSTSPANNRKPETEVYKPLEEIFTAVIAAARQLDLNLKQNFELKVGPHATLQTDIGGDSCPDGYFAILPHVLEEMREKMEGKMEETGWKDADMKWRKVDAGSSVKGASVYAPQEYKKIRQEDDNVTKLSYNMTRILARDPCRRFALGFTIENCDLRLWFLSRGTVLKTESFDFRKECEQLVRVFLSIAFSSAEDMGWDPTITFSHFDKADHGHYNILVHNEVEEQGTVRVSTQVFQSVETIIDSSADSPLGRGNRILKVRDAQGHIHVLKDVWLDSDRMGEYEIREKILNDVAKLKIPNLPGEQIRDIVKGHMLTTVAAGKVRVGLDNTAVVDDTVAVMLRGYNVEDAELVDLLVPPPVAPVGSQSHHYSVPEDQDCVIEIDSPTRFDQSLSEMPVSEPSLTLQQLPRVRLTLPESSLRRHHHRIVFKEYATTLRDERSLDNILSALLGAVEALQFIHAAGWVHRDISVGNLYWYGDTKMGLIGDLEYARHRDAEKSHLMRTGTPFFMASETIEKQYLFRPPPQKKKLTPGTFTIVTSEQEHELVVETQGETVFAYNPLHDLESIWWILVYVLFFNEDTKKPSPDPQARQAQMNLLFSGKMESTHRRSFLGSYDAAGQPYLSSTYKFALKMLHYIAQTITVAYVQAERLYPNIDHKFFLIHNDIIAALNAKQYREQLRNIELVSVKQTRQPLVDQVAHRDGSAKMTHSLEDADESEGPPKRKFRSAGVSLTSKCSQPPVEPRPKAKLSQSMKMRRTTVPKQAQGEHHKTSIKERMKPRMKPKMTTNDIRRL